MTTPKTSRIVDSRSVLLLEAKNRIYDDYVDIQEPIITSDDKKITKSKDMQITPELPQGIPESTLYNHKCQSKGYQANQHNGFNTATL